MSQVPTDLSQQMAGMSLENYEQTQLGRKSKRPARVFHTQFSDSNSQANGAQFPPPPSPVPFYTPIDQLAPPSMSYGQQPTYPGNSLQPSQQATSQLSNGQFNLGQEPQPQSFVISPQNTAYDGGSAQAAIPSIVADRAAAQQNLGPTPVFKTFENACPPLSGTDYDVQDQGVSGPQFARLTMYNIPATDALRASTKLPLGMLLRPLASFSNKECERGGVSVADFSNGVPPPRCRRCRTYMNPSMLFTEGGTKFTCNMCQFSNEVSPEYFQPIDITNRRIDWQSRPELALGTYDMLVPKDYWKEEGIEPVPLRHFVLIDVSRDAIKKGLPKLAVEAIRMALYGDGLDPGENAASSFSGENAGIYDANGTLMEKRIKYPTGTKIGIATYDSTVQFYNLNSKLEQAQMMVMGDIEDPFVPLEEGMFVDPEESRLVIEDLLDRIDVLFEDNPTEEPAFGCALDVALKTLKSGGGKVSAILSSLPSRGPGSLVVREGGENFTGEKEINLYSPDSKYYEDLGKEYALAGVGLDLFLFPSTHCDLANTGIVCQLSGGCEHFYAGFVPQRDGRRFIADFCKSCEGDIGTQAHLKVRSSTGLQIASYYGNFYHDGWEDEPIFGSINSHSTIGILFKYDGKLDHKLDAHFQSALLYTSSDGQRRVRVTNLIASVTDQFKPVVNFVDIDATIGIMARDSISRMNESSREEIRDRISNRLVDVFASYRKHVDSSLPANQLLMPMSLRGLMALSLALQKSIPLRYPQLVSDRRVHAGRLMNSFSATELNLFLYPRIIGLHNLQPADCKYSENGLFSMPVNVPACTPNLDVGGVYIVYNGESILLSVDKQVSPLLLKDLFGEYVVNLESLDPYMNELPELDTEVSRQARALVKYFTNKSGISFLGLQLARENLDGAYHDFKALMIEDRGMNTFGYPEFVNNTHKYVQDKLETAKQSRDKKSNFLSDYF